MEYTLATMNDQPAIKALLADIIKIPFPRRISPAAS